MNGSATSASNVGHRCGVHDSSRLIWIGGREHQFVRWSEIEHQVADSFENYLKKKAQAGIRVFGAEDRREAQIKEAIEQRKKSLPTFRATGNGLKSVVNRP